MYMLLYKYIKAIKNGINVDMPKKLEFFFLFYFWMQICFLGKSSVKKVFSTQFDLFEPY
jgi:hypothetical protein